MIPILFKVKPLEGYRLLLEYSNGEKRILVKQDCTQKGHRTFAVVIFDTGLFGQIAYN